MGDHRTHGLTWADLQQFPENDGLRRELIDGELLVSPSPVAAHQHVVTCILFELMTYLEPLGGRVFPAPLDVVFGESNVVEPDVLAFLAEHLDRIRDGYPRSAPDLVVEVTSPSTNGVDRLRKRALYERFGVPEYWIVDLDDDALEAYVLDDDGSYGTPRRYGAGDTVTATAIPGFSAPYERLVGR